MVAGGFHMMLHERNVGFDGTCPSAASAIILATCDYITQIHSNPAECTRQNAFEPLIEAAITTAINRSSWGWHAERKRTGTPPDQASLHRHRSKLGHLRRRQAVVHHHPTTHPQKKSFPSIIQLIVPILLCSRRP